MGIKLGQARKKFEEKLSGAVEHARRFADWKPWRTIARATQLPPEGKWFVWLISAGRGFGKTRVGAECCIEHARANPKARIALVGRTTADVRAVMIEGESGILAVSPPDFIPVYEPSKRRLTWPNGAIAETFSSEKPDQVRGPQFTFAWGDEAAAWKDAHKGRKAAGSTYNNLSLAVRKGADPRIVLTTTPKPVQLIIDLVERKSTVTTGGSTYDNAANLAETFLEEIRDAYEGTEVGRQEINGELILDNPRALWTRSTIDPYRVEFDVVPELEVVVVAIDPAASAEGAKNGIVIAGRGKDGHYYVFDDRSLQGSPDQWANAAVGQYELYEANYIVAEKNNGGDMVEATIRALGDFAGKVKLVWASRGKHTRAEPVSRLYEQGKVHHVGDPRKFAALEAQMCRWEPGMESPDQMDALVWAITAVMVVPKRLGGVTGNAKAA